MSFSRLELDRLKHSIAISDLARHLGLDVQNGRSRCFNSLAHAHGDRTPSLSFSNERQSYRCWVCEHIRGDHFDLIRALRSCSFTEAVNGLAQIVGGGALTLSDRRMQVIPSPQNPKAVSVDSVSQVVFDRQHILDEFFRLLEVPTGDAEKYLRGRKIFSQAIAQCKIKMIPHAHSFGDRLLERFSLEDLQKAGLFSPKGFFRYWNHPLIFPYVKNGVVSWFQARSIEPGQNPKELNLTGSVPCPFNVKVLNGKIGHVYVCEGVIDALTLIQRGQEAVALPGVGSFREEWIALFAEKTVFLLLDGDDAGQKAAEKIATALTSAGIRVYWEPVGSESRAHGYKSAADFKGSPLAWGQDLNDTFKTKR